MATTQLTADQFQIGHIDSSSIKDRYGNPTTVQGDWAWVSANEDIVTVTSENAGTTFTMTTTGVEGAFTVTGTADADLGDGVVPIIAVVSGVVTAGQATVVEVTLDAPAQKP